MRSKKPIWAFKAMRVKITRSGSLTVEDAHKISPHTNKKVLQSAARRVVKKLLRKKRRHLPLEVLGHTL